MSERVALVPATDLNLTLRRGQKATKRVKAPSEVEGPMPAGRRVGSIDVLQDGRVVRRVPLVTAPRSGRPRFRASVLHSVGCPLTLLAG